jgi:arylamine N-acetyltransferase
LAGKLQARRVSESKTERRLRDHRVHIVNIVTLPDGTKWMLDVGFGGDGATKPLPMIPEHVTLNLGTQEIRLIHSTIPQQVDQTKLLWIYQYRNGPTKEWNSFYAFPEFEFLPQDFEIMNYFTSTSQGETNFQTRTVLIVRFLREGESITGKVMLVNGEVKKNLGGKTEVVMVCGTEKERVEAIEKYFAITLTDEEIAGVKGRNVELVGP